MLGRNTRSSLSVAAWSIVAVAAVPADPTITAPAILPRANPASFIGWVEYSGSWYSETCNPGLTWYQDGKYAQCCAATLASCYAATACASGSMIYPYPDKSSTKTIACTENFGDNALSICNTAFIFENMGDSNPRTDIICGSESINWSYYRSVPASITEASSRASLSKAQAAASSAVAAPSGGTAQKKGSKAWIAGVVVGPLSGLVLVIALVWFCLRRRKNQKTQQSTAAMTSTNPSQPIGVGGYTTDSKPQFTQQQQPVFGQDGHANQSAYTAQQTYLEAPGSPAPQYSAGNAPYSPPISPPPQQAYHGNDFKSAYMPAPAGNASELGGETKAGAPAAQTLSHSHTAELGGGSRQGVVGQTGPSELPTTGSNNRAT
ncbi:hypothetical protein DE146DRAFT_753125 [Phaeosphaeria sp. MPI-PUGE-AT-0046c]|nr:hypothetical protein DE146DRAFT_753125 [Phaeosphaeria sp. MPI-PUGE-AT-0046c]